MGGEAMAYMQTRLDAPKEALASGTLTVTFEVLVAPLQLRPHGSLEQVREFVAELGLSPSREVLYHRGPTAAVRCLRLPCDASLAFPV